MATPTALTAAVAPADATDKKVKWTVTAGTDKVKLYKDADCKTEVGTDVTDALTVYAKGLAVGEATVKVESNEDETKTATCAVTAKHGTYAVTMKAGVTDGDQWTARAGGSGDFAAMPLKGVEGGTKPVELKYAGDREVKRVTMRVVPTWKGDLSKLSATELESDGVTVLVKDGMTLTGTLAENYKITIADGATVTLDGVTINGGDNPYDDNCNWAGITCLGTATIVLKDGTENTVKGFFRNYPGIDVPAGSTLTIQGGTEGTGKLTASSSGLGAGIGGAVGISCGNISITGGTVTATGGSNSPGIGGGYNASCGNITITDGVTKVTATKGDSSAPYSIGASNGGTCGTVTIGGTTYWQGGQAVDEAAATYLAKATIVYPKPLVVDLSTLTGHTELQDGDVVTGTLDGLSQPYKITIAAGATVTLNGVTINGVNSLSYRWAGINCAGNATIILKDGSANTVKGFYYVYPGIHVPSGYTLTITGETQGTGSLTASPFDGGGTTESNAAGIGGGEDDGVNVTSCGNIIISGGTITATGGQRAAGIGGGGFNSCGNLTITDGVNSVTAIKGPDAENSIGGNTGGGGSFGTVTIGGTVYYDAEFSDYFNGGATYLAKSPLVYPSLKTLTVTGQTIYYAEGETWSQAIQNHPTENAGWSINADGEVLYGDEWLMVGDNFVKGNTTINPSTPYDLD